MEHPTLPFERWTRLGHRRVVSGGDTIIIRYRGRRYHAIVLNIHNYGRPVHNNLCRRHILVQVFALV